MNILHKIYSQKNSNTFFSSSGLAHIFAQSWAPEKREDVKAIFQITHGMAEHSDRYEDFANHLVGCGYAVFIHEHIGHGRSVKDESQLGYFGEDNNSWTHLVEDCHLMTQLAKKEYPDVPVILFGHSMGSFVARAYIAKYSDDISAAIICGTSGPNPASGLGVHIASLIGKIKGFDHKSLFLNNLAFGSYNKKFIKTEKDTGFNWLSVNKDNVEYYNNDPLCGYCFTVSGFKGLFGLLTYVSGNEWFDKVPDKLPILFTAGVDDPVGNYSKGVVYVYDKLKNSNHNEIDLKLWPGLRHEILNEKSNKEVYEYISSWTDGKI